MISFEYKENNSEIQWTDIYGLRNRIVHDRGNMVLDVIYQILIDENNKDELIKAVKDVYMDNEYINS